jgi:hypothetical protein
MISVCFHATDLDLPDARLWIAVERAVVRLPREAIRVILLMLLSAAVRLPSGVTLGIEILVSQSALSKPTRSATTSPNG